MTIPLFLSQKNDDDSSGNDGYVYGQNVLGADKEFKEWVLLQTGYITTKEQDKNGDISETNGIPFRKICKKKREKTVNE